MSETQPTTQKKTKAEPVKTYLDEAGEKTVTEMKATVKAPGTRIGYLARGFETTLRDLQARLDADGKAVQVQSIMGHENTIPIMVKFPVGFSIKVGDGAETNYNFVLRPGPHPEPVPQAPATQSAATTPPTTTPVEIVTIPNKPTSTTPEGPTVVVTPRVWPHQQI